MKATNSGSIMTVITMATLLSFSSAVFAQESGSPNQSGGQEPEVPGTSSSTPHKPVQPDSDSSPKTQREKDKEREFRAQKQRKCAPGKDAKACREHGVKKRQN